MQKREFLKLNRLDPLRPIINNLGIPWEIVAHLNKYKPFREVEAKPLELDQAHTAHSYAEVLARSKKTETEAAHRELVDIKPPQSRQAKVFYLRLKLTLRFAVTAAIIFLTLFSISNFRAVRQIISYKIDEYSGQLAKDPNRQILNDINDNENRNIGSDIRNNEAKSVEESIYDAKREVLDFSAYNVSPPDNRIIIPRINKNIPLRHIDNTENLLNRNWEALEKQIQSELLYGAVLYPGTVDPGYFGNVTITAHSSYYPWANPKDYIDAFALLNEMKIGDEVAVFFEGNKYVYRVFDVFEVEPSETSVLEQPEDKSELTLITCTPVGTTLRRLIVKATQVSPDPEENKVPSRKKVLIREAGKLHS